MKHKLNCDCPFCRSAIGESHKLDCQCVACKNERGELSGENAGRYKHGNLCKDKIHYCIESGCNEVVCGVNRRCNKHAQLKRFKNPKEKEKLKGKTPWNKLPKEIRVCVCGCDETFECIITSKQRFIYTHGAKNGNNGNYKDGRTKKQYYCIELDCNKKVSGPNKRCKSHATKLDWKNEEYRDKTIKAILKSVKITPNKPEKILNKLLQEILPKEYKFVGDGKVVIDGFCPDFINCNGQKKIIEHFGCYWHANPIIYKANDILSGGKLAKDIWKTNQKRLKTYTKYGYKTLIIWESEMKNINKVKEKILSFHSRRGIS